MPVNTRALAAVLVGLLVGVAAVAVALWVAWRDSGAAAVREARAVLPQPPRAPSPPDDASPGAPGVARPGAREPRAAPSLDPVQPPRPAVPLDPAQAQRLREAQDEYLRRLLTDPRDERAMRDLVRVRSELAGGDPRILRARAAAYRLAIAQGREADEHYTPAALALLAEADETAARLIERERRTPSPGGARFPGHGKERYD